VSRAPTHLVFASVAVLDGDAMLLVQEGKPDVRGMWSLPGGSVEAGEDPLAAARREVREETGLVVEPTGLLGVWTDARWIWFVFAAEHQRTELVAGDDILAARWWRRADVRRLAGHTAYEPRLIRRVLDALDGGATLPAAVVAGLRADD
jgi:ADP-ribose pyrophosphatase YjhB (NUDIX family)